MSYNLFVTIAIALKMIKIPNDSQERNMNEITNGGSKKKLYWTVKHSDLKN